MIPIRRTEEYVGDLRWDDCEEYSDCLSEAAALNLWAFSCEGCERYVQVPPEEPDYYAKTDRNVYPPAPEYDGDMKELCELLSIIERRMGLPTGDFRETNNRNWIQEKRKRASKKTKGILSE